MVDFNQAIDHVTSYRDMILSARDALNEGKTVTRTERTNHQVDYEIFVRPYADALDMHDPGQMEGHLGYVLKFDNPVEYAAKDGSFYSLNLAIPFLNSLLGRLELYRDQPDKFLPASRKLDIEPSPLIDESRLSDIRALKVVGFDLARLIRLCEEVNDCYKIGACHAVIMITRSIIDHVPPLFGFRNFSEVANNYNGLKSFKESMNHLEGARKIADLHLHGPIRDSESLPNPTQVNFSPHIDLLLAEIVRIKRS